MSRQLVLLGAGHAHVHVLAQLAARPLPGTVVTLVSRHERQLYSGMVPGLVAGRFRRDECEMALAPLVLAAGVRWLKQEVIALSADARELLLDDGAKLSYDWLSINTGGVQDRERLETALPGARANGLFVRPIEKFAQLWPQVVRLANTRALRVTVIGAGAAGIELAFAARQAMPEAAVTLLSGGGQVAAGYSAGMRRRVMAALTLRRINVLPERAVGIESDQIHLAQGARLACDVTLLATGSQAPAWLHNSGLALDAQGFLAVDACQRSTSHPTVLAAGDVASRIDRLLPRSGVYAVRGGPVLARQWAALANGKDLRIYQPPARSLNLLSCGDGTAIASWGGVSAHGRWAGWLKDRIDRRFIARFGSV